VITITERGTLALSAALVVAVAAIAIYSRARGRWAGTPAAAEGE